MSIRRTLLAISFTLCAAVPAVWILSVYTPISPVKNAPAVVPQFDGSLAMQHLEILTHRFRGRVVGSAQGFAAADYAAAQFWSYGLKVDTQDFCEAGAFGNFERGWFQGRNVIGVLPGRERGTVVLTAHRDCVPQSPEGAYDNGSGSAAVLELARALAGSKPHRYSYAFVELDGEEVGCAGSRVLLNTRPIGLEDIRLMINLDMVGFRGRNQVCIDHTQFLSPEARALAASFFILPQYLLIQIPLGRGSDAMLYCWRGLPTLDIFEIPTLAQMEIHNDRDTTNQISADSIQQTGRTVERLILQGDAMGSFTPTRGLAAYDGLGVLMPWHYRVGGICILVALAIPILFRFRFLICGGRPAWILVVLTLLSGIFAFLSAFWRGGILFTVFPAIVFIAFLILQAVFLRREKRTDPGLGRFFVAAAPVALFASVWILTGLWPLGLLLAFAAYFPAIFLTWKPGWGWRLLDVFLLLPSTLLTWILSLAAWMLAPTHVFLPAKLALFVAILNGVALIGIWGISGRRPGRSTFNLPCSGNGNL